MNTLKDAFKYISFTKFVTDYTSFGVNSGIRARMQGQGTNEKDKRTELTTTEKEGLKTGLKSFIGQLQKIEAEL
jgi:hypothetical protein